MVGSMNIYKYLNINVGTVLKIQEMLKFVSDHLKTREMCKHVVKKLPSLSKYVSVHYRTQAMLIENCGTLRYVPDCYKNKKICKKTIDNYPYALEFVLESYKTKKMCDKAVDTYPSTI